MEQKITRKNAVQFIHHVLGLAVQIENGHPAGWTPGTVSNMIRTFAAESGIELPRTCPGSAHEPGAGHHPTCCVCMGAYSYGVLGKAVKVT